VHLEEDTKTCHHILILHHWRILCHVLMPSIPRQQMWISYNSHKYIATTFSDIYPWRPVCWISFEDEITGICVPSITPINANVEIWCETRPLKSRMYGSEFWISRFDNIRREQEHTRQDFLRFATQSRQTSQSNF